MQPKFTHKPIPGISLTGTPGNAPWEQPPKYTTLDEVVDYYSDKLTEEEVINNLIDAIKRDIPLMTIADGITRAGIMEGMHTIDTAMLVKPIVIELMIALAEIYDIKYVIQAEDIETMRVMPVDVVQKVVSETVEKMEDVKEETGGMIARRKK